MGILRNDTLEVLICYFRVNGDLTILIVTAESETMRTHRPVEVSNVVPIRELFEVRGEEEDVQQVQQRGKRRRTNIPRNDPNSAPQYRVYCPCRKCDLRSKPTLRLLRICDEHIALHGVGVKWKVRYLSVVHMPYLILYCKI